MINIKELTKADVGRWVEYQNSYGQIEKGKIKSWNNKYIFVVYHCDDKWDNFQDYTAAATKPEDLFWVRHYTVHNKPC